MEAMEHRTAEEVTEVLEAVWTLQERGPVTLGKLIQNAPVKVTDELLARLIDEGLISVDSEKHVRLLSPGRKQAEQIIRRHRLLAEGITNSICTLLGHPRYCPHNRPIPEGECCRQARDELKPIVVSCDQLRIGESASVAYFCTRDHSRLLKLSALGISPGMPLKLIQKWPAYVVQCEETEIALEPDVAKNIYVWQTPE
jgi:DtxR family Mn-dependent transcriptional regulator